MKFMIELYNEENGNFAGWEVNVESFEEAEELAKEDCTEYQWYEITEIKD